jgi:hypothetical protein
MNKINKDLLKNALKELGMNLECAVKYDKNTLFRLSEKYTLCEIGERFYCCFGIEKSCWGDSYSLGQNGLTHEVLCKISESRLKKFSKYLYNSGKYGNRIYLREHEDKYCIMFLYLRDVVGSDFEFLFSN